MRSHAEFCFDPRVSAARTHATGGGYAPDSGAGDSPVSDALSRAAGALGWSDGARGAFGHVIARGARVLVKPNLVLHENQGPWGVEPLVTHPSLIRAAVEEALRAGASEVLVGDAPIQGCDFAKLLDVTGLGAWAAELTKAEPRFKGVRDFRRTTSVFVDGVRVATENQQPEENFVLFDLGRESLLEPVTDARGSFRVTCYDPRLLRETHAPGRHRYLVAREILDADVVINLPKLKTHKKAGITCALKNLIGINGNKEYLPHHRVGGSTNGGDCYAGASPVKRTIERVLDRQNMTKSPATARALHGLTVQLQRVARLAGEDPDTEGSWSGNDTIWRTCLDLNRILLYGRADATMRDEVQRRVVHVADAVVAGQGNGPLAPEPLALGLVLAGHNAVAVDWVGAHLLNYEPEKISITREAFREFRWPLAPFAPEDITLAGDFGTGDARGVLESRGKPLSIKHPVGWRDASAGGSATFAGDSENGDGARLYAEEKIVE